MNEVKEILKESLLCKEEFGEVLSNQTEFDALRSIVNREFQKAVEWARLTNELAYVNNYINILCRKFPEASPILISRIADLLPFIWRCSDGVFIINRKLKAKLTRNMVLNFDLIVCDANELIFGQRKKKKEWEAYLENADEAAIVGILRSLLKEKPYKGFDPEGILKILIGLRNRKARKGSKR